MTSAGAMTNDGKNLMVDRFLRSTKSIVEEIRIGSDRTTPTETDTDLGMPVPVVARASLTTIDSCDATTGWTNSNDADPETLNTTTNEFLEGTGALNLPTTFSSGTATWSKTIGSTDLSGKFAYLFFYIADSTDLTTASDAVQLVLGTGGFTDTNEYDFANTFIQNGFNTLVMDIDNPTGTTGSGATESTIDRIRINVKLGSSQVTNDMRMDFWHSATTSQLDLSIDSGYPTFDTVNKIGTIRFTLGSAAAQDYNLREVGSRNTDAPAVTATRDTHDEITNSLTEQQIYIIQFKIL